MSKLIDFKELEVSLKTEKSSKIVSLHKLIFGTQGDRKNRQRIRNFSGFHFEIGSDEYENKLAKTKIDFSVNDLISISDVLCLDNSGSINDLATRIISSLCDLEFLKRNILHEENESDDEGGGGIQKFRVKNRV